MNLAMKSRCEQCAVDLAADGDAYICSFDCTFCPACASRFQDICPHCGGELVPRPRRTGSVQRFNHPDKVEPLSGIRSWRIWSLSFGVWFFVSLAATATIYEMYHLTEPETRLRTIAGMEFSSIFTYAPLTPLVFFFATRYQFTRSNWRKRALLHLAGGILFTIAHIASRAVTPYGYFDPADRMWGSAVWNSRLHTFRNPLPLFKGMFLMSVVDDIVWTYLPIVLIAHVVTYYRSLREREVRTTQLEGQLAKARLQTLKSQLQPHFLFNTLHSISALMLTDVIAADRMMTSLSDLLRMSLERNETQVGTLSWEVEFLQVYLEIEKTRFEDRLRAVFEIAPECLDAQIPHLLLQPVVENAVRHGVSRRSTPGEIRIVAKHVGEDLHVWIRDNGPGFTDPEVREGSQGLGLKLTRERLLAMYGRKQKCEIRNAAEGGAEVHLQMPFSIAPVASRSTVTSTVPEPSEQ